MKKYLVTGLIILMPLVLTILILVFLIDFFTAPFLDAVRNFILNQDLPIALPLGLVTTIARIVIIIGIVVLIFLLGIVTRWFFFRSIINATNKLLSKIPFVKSIFNITKDIFSAFVTTGARKAIKTPVIINFPSESIYAVGFETGEIPLSCQKHIKEELTPVFVPTAPHPISGYLMFVKSDKIKKIDMTVEEAIKFTVSCGMILPEEIREKKENAIKHK
jgi:uncharacterized membrane protein